MTTTGHSRSVPRRASKVTIAAADRVCLFGRTGSGKTTLARRLLVSAPRFVVLDAKHTFKLAGVPVVPEVNVKLPRQIVRVPVSMYERELWEAAIEEVWSMGDCILYVDETTLITGARTLNPALGKAIRTGRERGVGVWCASQRPKDLPSAIFTEAEHFFLFQLTFAADREKVSSFTHDAIGPLLDAVRGHDFVYYNVLTMRALRVRALKGER